VKTLDYSDILLEKNISLVKKKITQNRVICYPTDTLYGLGGNFFSPGLIKKIDKLKNRSNLPYSVAVSGMAMLEKLVSAIPDIFPELSGVLFPGKFTFLFRASPELSRTLLKNSPKIGIRIPGLPLLLELINRLDLPLVSTSVNRSHQPPLNDPGSIRAQFPGIDLLIDKGPLEKSAGSTILDITTTPITCIRRGDDIHKLRELGLTVIDREPGPDT
jgi:L-threonylcarbamoyladenylate synthase